MRLITCLLAGLLVLAAGQITLDSRGGSQAVQASAVQTDSAPIVMNARVSGKKLIVTGENFRPGAVIYVNGVKQKTKNDSDSPGTVLIAKKAGKKIPGGAVVTIEVLNAADSRSDAFGFFSGPTVTLDDGAKTIELKVGERFLLVLKKSNFEWEASVEDSSVLKKVTDVEIIAGAQGIFEALQPGRTRLVAIGNPPCSKLTPPCAMPSLQFQINVVVQ